jgi:hypothetical protein
MLDARQQTGTPFMARFNPGQPAGFHLAEIGGYGLERLSDRMKAALEDAQHEPAKWKVLTGWNESSSRENEIWKTVAKTELLKIICGILWLIDFAKENKLKLIVFGDGSMAVCPQSCLNAI